VQRLLELRFILFELKNALLRLIDAREFPILGLKGLELEPEICVGLALVDELLLKLPNALLLEGLILLDRL